MNPVATEALINLTLGANDPNGSGHGPLPLHAQVRHFDPDRAGLASEDVAALVEKITPDGVTLTLVNTHPFSFETRWFRAAATASTTIASIVVGGTFAVDAPYVRVRLAPGAGETLTISFAATRTSPRWRSRGIAAGWSGSRNSQKIRRSGGLFSWSLCALLFKSLSRMSSLGELLFAKNGTAYLGFFTNCLYLVRAASGPPLPKHLCAWLSMKGNLTMRLTSAVVLAAALVFPHAARPHKHPSTDSVRCP